MSTAVDPVVSVVIPTFNRRDRLRRTLEGLADQRGVDGLFEVIVVSDGSTDGTDSFLRSDAPLTVTALNQANAGPGAARNTGIASARGELVVFLDDDVVPDPGLLAAHLAGHEAPDDDLVLVGPMLTPPDTVLAPWVQWEQDMLYKQYDAMARGDYSATARQFYTGNASVARRHLDAAGGFDPSLRRAEDVELAYRLADRGLRFGFDPEAVVLHYADRSFSAWLDVARSYGRNDVVFARDRGQAWLLDAISTEFHGRHTLVRGLTRVCLPRPRLARVATALLSTAVNAAGVVHLGAVSPPALSAVYNLAYYCGMADELGSAEALLARFDGAALAP